MSNFRPLVFVGRGSETQTQVGGNLNTSMYGFKALRHNGSPCRALKSVSGGGGGCRAVDHFPMRQNKADVA